MPLGAQGGTKGRKVTTKPLTATQLVGGLLLITHRSLLIRHRNVNTEAPPACVY